MKRGFRVKSYVNIPLLHEVKTETDTGSSRCIFGLVTGKIESASIMKIGFYLLSLVLGIASCFDLSAEGKV